MSSAPITGHGRIRRAALFLLVALGAEAMSLFWRHPLSIYFFGIAGSLLIFLGVVSFLLSFVSRSPDSDYWQPMEEEEEEDRRTAQG